MFSTFSAFFKHLLPNQRVIGLQTVFLNNNVTMVVVSLAKVFKAWKQKALWPPMQTLFVLRDKPKRHLRRRFKALRLLILQILNQRTFPDTMICNPGYSYIFTNKPCLTVTITLFIVSIRKFSIVIGSPRAYLSRNRHSITWVSNYRCPIWTFCNGIPILDLHCHAI